MMPEDVITKQLLKSKTGEFDIESILCLNLPLLGLCDLGCIGQCTNLIHLDLSGNKLSMLQPLHGLNNLLTLDLSSNRIHTLEGLQSLENLESLNLSGNRINSINELNYLSGLNNFTKLCLTNETKALTNPLLQNAFYKDTVLKILPNLSMLDGEMLRGKDALVFQMFKSIDRVQASLLNYEAIPIENLLLEKLPEDFWEKNEKLDEFNRSHFGDAKNQFEYLVADCRRLMDETDNKLEKLNSSSNEKDE